MIIQDLTFCYLHMTEHELEVLDTIGTSEYLDFQMNVDNGTVLVLRNYNTANTRLSS